MPCIKAEISGLVQGVFYRHYTHKKALALQLTGWVKNLSNGKVELVACGNQAAIDALIAWLWQGPPTAEVQHVTFEKIKPCEFNTFEILR